MALASDSRRFFASAWPATASRVSRGWDKLDQPLARPLDEILFLGREFRPIGGRAVTGRHRDHRPQAFEREATRDGGRPLHRIHLRCRHAGSKRRKHGKSLPLLGIGKRHADRRHGRIGHERGMHLHEAVGEQHDRHVDASQQRIGRPAQHTHQPASPCPRTRSRVTGRSKILTVVEHDGDPFPLLGRVDEVAFEQGVDGRDRLIGITRPGGGVAEPFREPLRHRPQATGIGARQRPQALAHIVGEHDVPAAKQLPREKIRHRAPAGGRQGSRRPQRNEVADIAVQQKHATCAGEIRIAKPFCPRRTPGR